jgi:hypothetical protein
MFVKSYLTMLASLVILGLTNNFDFGLCLVSLILNCFFVYIAIACFRIASRAIMNRGD